MIHDFKTDLRFSEISSDELFWDAVYRKAFPNMVNHMLCQGDTASQRMGIDRLVFLSNGRELRIDEKKRRCEYGDILLEYLSNNSTGAPGWVEKDLYIDYLAYAFMPLQKVYLFDWPMLRRAWCQYGAQWKRQYKQVIAKNNGYQTFSVPVPTAVLNAAVSNARIIQL